MSRFLYFIPNVDHATPADIAAAGLADRFASRGGKLAAFVQVPAAGHDAMGVMLALGEEEISNPSRKRLWFDLGTGAWGAKEGAAPGPADLERESLIHGHEVRLADGNDWTVPLCLRWNDERLQHERSLPSEPRHIAGDGVQDFTRPEFQELEVLSAQCFAMFAHNRVMPLDILETYAA